MEMSQTVVWSTGAAGFSVSCPSPFLFIEADSVDGIVRQIRTAPIIQRPFFFGVENYCELLPENSGKKQDRKADRAGDTAASDVLDIHGKAGPLPIFFRLRGVPGDIAQHQNIGEKKD